jgi:hypothetical protein
MTQAKVGTVHGFSGTPSSSWPTQSGGWQLKGKEGVGQEREVGNSRDSPGRVALGPGGSQLSGLGVVVHPCQPVIPALERLRQDDHEFETSQVYIASWRTAWVCALCISPVSVGDTCILPDVSEAGLTHEVNPTNGSSRPLPVSKITRAGGVAEHLPSKHKPQDCQNNKNLPGFL